MQLGRELAACSSRAAGFSPSISAAMARPSVAETWSLCPSWLKGFSSVSRNRAATARAVDSSTPTSSTAKVAQDIHTGRRPTKTNTMTATTKPARHSRRCGGPRSQIELLASRESSSASIPQGSDRSLQHEMRQIAPLDTCQIPMRFTAGQVLPSNSDIGSVCVRYFFNSRSSLTLSDGSCAAASNPRPRTTSCWPTLSATSDLHRGPSVS